jgi:hypothetical protein
MRQSTHRNDLAAVTEWMQELGALPEDGVTGLDPQQIWWKAELLRRWDARRRAEAPIQVGERVQIAIGLAGAVMLLGWLIRHLPGETASSTLTVVILASILLIGSAAAFAVWSMVADE